MEKIYLYLRTISTEPAGREEDDGEFSGAAFYDQYLEPKFQEACNDEKILIVNMDGVEGYSTSFLNGSFGKLGEVYAHDVIRKHLIIESNDDALLIDEINDQLFGETNSLVIPE